LRNSGPAPPAKDLSSSHGPGVLKPASGPVAFAP
jgi:hypothetical protein